MGEWAETWYGGSGEVAPSDGWSDVSPPRPILKIFGCLFLVAFWVNLICITHLMCIIS